MLGKKGKAEVKVFKQKDPNTGQAKEVVQEQIKLPTKNPKGVLANSVTLKLFVRNILSGGSTHVVKTVDPESGKTVQQFLQTQVDPTTGQSTQTLIPITSGSSQGNESILKSFF